MTTFTGLFRDFVIALLGVLALFGIRISNDQVAGIVLLVTTALALGTYVYKSNRKGGGG